MEQRHQQIRERAGLEEARLNVEFIDFLRKWGPVVLTVAAIAAGGRFVWMKYHAAKIDKINRAFDEYNKSAMTANPSPLALKAVAEEYNGVRGIGQMARLDAADAYLRSVRAGIKPSATLKPDGTVETADDLLTEQDRATYLGEAEALYNKVLSDASSADQTMMSVSALYGLAAVAESRKEFDKAKGYYEQIASKVEGGPYAYHATLAKTRIAELPKLAELPRLYTIAELPKIKGVDPEPPPPAPTPGPVGPGLQGDPPAPLPSIQPGSIAPLDTTPTPSPAMPDVPPADAPKPDSPAPDAPKPADPAQPGSTPPASDPK